MDRSHGRYSIAPSAAPRDLMAPQRLAGAWTARVVTLFPGAFPGVLGDSLTGTALTRGLWSLETVDLRAFGLGKHRQVDDTPAGGGPGLVMRADVVGPALEAALAGTTPAWPRVYLSPRGAPFVQETARAWSAAPGVVMLAGRFEGVDQRVIDHYGLTEVSLGDFVLTGGEIAAQAMLDATVRLLPGVLGNAASTEDESFAAGLLEHPQYTRPADWQGRTIPEVLTSGDHGRVARWRRDAALRLTQERRPDLLAALPLDPQAPNG